MKYAKNYIIIITKPNSVILNDYAEDFFVNSLIIRLFFFCVALFFHNSRLDDMADKLLLQEITQKEQTHTKK